MKNLDSGSQVAFGIFGIVFILFFKAISFILRKSGLTLAIGYTIVTAILVEGFGYTILKEDFIYIPMLALMIVVGIGIQIFKLIQFLGNAYRRNT